MRALTRRTFLGSLGLLTLGGRRLYSATPAWRPVDWPFTLGVASGEPAPDGFVIWTRLAPDPLNGGGMPPLPVSVTWEVARDEQMQQVVRHGSAVAWPEWAHAIHVEVTGLDPDQWYWYRFRVRDALSLVGRGRTLPPADAAAARLRFAFASCQHYEQGFFSAHRHLAAEDLAFVFHLGDYIYEGPAREGRPRRHLGPELYSLEDYRNRHAQYKMDPDLQAAHAASPWIVTWDDHDVADNYAGPYSEREDPVAEFLARRAAAYQAYYEHMPLRPRSSPHGPDARLYRGFTVGQLASFFVLDTRQYRTHQPCGDNTTWPCDGMLDPQGTMMGAKQERWLFDRFHRSPSRWNIVPQQVMVAKVNRRQNGRDRYSMDHWAGYERERQRLLACLGSRPAANPVVLTGDLHSSWVNDLRARPDAPTVATEFVGTSISSGGDGQDFPRHMEPVLSDNPFVKFYNEQRGYVSCEITPATMRADYRVVEFVSEPGAACQTRASFVVENGRAGANRD